MSDEAKRVEAALERKIGTGRFEAWFARKSAFQVSGDRVVIVLTNSMQCDFVARHLGAEIRAAAEDELGGKLSITYAVDPELVKLGEAVKPSEAAVIEEPTVLPVPKLLKLAKHFRDLPIVNIPFGIKHFARSIGEIDELPMHWVDGGTVPCFGKECKHCPGRRLLYGYFDAILCRYNARAGGQELFRAVQVVPEGVLKQIKADLAEGEMIRGFKLCFFRKAKGSLTKVEVLETECPFELPEPLSVRDALMSRFNLPYWPGTQAAEVSDTNILKFRKQA